MFSCRGHPNQLQRGKYALFGLVWFGGHPNQLQRLPLQCPWSGVFKKVYHVGVNIDYLGCLHWRLQLEVTMISCRGHPNQLQRSPLHCPWCGIFKKVYHVGVNMHCTLGQLSIARLVFIYICRKWPNLHPPSPQKIGLSCKNQL